MLVVTPRISAPIIQDLDACVIPVSIFDNRLYNNETLSSWIIIAPAIFFRRRYNPLSPLVPFKEKLRGGSELLP